MIRKPSRHCCLLSFPTHSFHTSTNPQHTQLLSLIPLCQNPQHLKPLSSLLIVHGLLTHEPFITRFINHCSHLGASQLLLSTFKILKKPNIFLQNLVVRSLCKGNLFEDVLYVYRKCRILGCPSDNYTFPFVIKACSVLNDVNLCRTTHGIVVKTGFDGNVVVQTALIDFYSKFGAIDSAYLLLDELSEPDLVAYNAFISGCSYNGLDEEAFKGLKTMCDLSLRPNLSTLASIIPVCSRLANLDIGRSLHGLSVKSGYFMDESLIPALISMYAGYGDLSIARDIFNSALEKNVTVYNAMIAACTRNQQAYDAFELFIDMLRDGMQPSIVTFVSIIPSCESFGSIWYGESLHGCVIKCGFENQASVLTALLSMYGKLGDVDSADYIFRNMPNRNLLSWNSIISTYVSNSLWVPSLAAFGEMQLSACDPDAISIVSILSSCTELEAFMLGKSVHSFSLKKGIDRNMNASNALLAFYSDCGNLSSSLKLFNRMVARNIVSWNTLVSGCINNGEIENALLVFHQMQKLDVGFDLITLISILPSCNETMALGIVIHGYAIKSGLASDVSLANSLITMYLNCGELKAGKLVFEEMPRRSLVSWNALMTGYRYLNLQLDVVTLFNHMISENQGPNYVTLLNVLPVCYTHSQGKAAHAYAIKTKIPLETNLLTSLMLIYARFENMKSCLLLFHMGDIKKISLWNAIISALVYSKNTKTALYFFCELLRREMKPDYITVLSLISVCIELNNLKFSDSLLGYLVKNGFNKDITIGNSLIDMYAKCGNISFAKNLFEALPRKDGFSWSVMINGYGLHGDGEAAFTLFKEMKLSGLRPDDVTCLSILSACSHGGLVEQARVVFNSMIHEGIPPRMEHYACLINLLSRTGYLDEAYRFVKSLPQKPSMDLLLSLLGACLTYGNVELGEEVGRLLLGRMPKSSAAYVILHNIYAAAGRWTDANRLRSEMEEKQLMKIPGISFVEGNEYMH